MKNTAETVGWKRRYQTALRCYLRQEDPAHLQAALKLGKEAAALGMETLDIALIHTTALASFVPDDNALRTRRQWAGLAERFFAETVTPIEKTHDASLKAAARVHKVTQMLHECNAESTASAKLLQKTISKRRKAETALDTSEKTRRKLSRESKELNALLRKKTREILMAQEKKDKESSLHLQNEVAQILLALDLRLLALKKTAEAGTRKFSKELDDTQQMVQKSSDRIGDVD